MPAYMMMSQFVTLGRPVSRQDLDELDATDVASAGYEKFADRSSRQRERSRLSAQTGAAPNHRAHHSNRRNADNPAGEAGL